jgi:hypothetical protein
MKSAYTAKKTILASSVFLGMALGTAHAEKCFQLKPFSDVIRVSGINIFGPGPGPGTTHTVFVGSWIAPGTPPPPATAYVLPIVGSRAFDANSTTVKRYGFHGTNVTGAFNGNESCALDGISGGAWSLACPAGPGGAAFTNSGSPFDPVPCAGLRPSVSARGAAGDPH